MFTWPSPKSKAEQQTAAVQDKEARPQPKKAYGPYGRPAKSREGNTDPFNSLRKQASSNYFPKKK